MNPMQELDRRIIKDHFKTGEHNILDFPIIKTPKWQDDISRRLYYSYLQYLIEKETQKIFQERPSLP